MQPQDSSPKVNFQLPPLEVSYMASVRELTPEDIGVIKARLLRGDLQHRIAAAYDINSGRISEINTGKRFQGIQPNMEPLNG